MPLYIIFVAALAVWLVNNFYSNKIIVKLVMICFVSINCGNNIAREILIVQSRLNIVPSSFCIVSIGYMSII